MTNGSSQSQGEGNAEKTGNGDESSESHRPEEKGKCLYCEKIILISELKNHYITEHWDQPFWYIYVCSNCGREFRGDDYERYKNHVAVAQLDTALKCKPVCQHCGEEFENIDLLKSHLKDQFEDPSRKCSTCDSQYTYRCGFEKHERDGSCKKRPLSCKYCGRTFNTVEDVEQHEKKVVRYDPIRECPTCKKKFEYSCDYKWHCKQRRFRCECCKRRYCSEELLENHVKRQLESKKKKQCLNCKKIFQHRCAYKYHKKLLECSPDVAPFSCRYKCGARRSSKKNILVHEKEHGRSTQKCRPCGMKVDRHYYQEHEQLCKLGFTNVALAMVTSPKRSPSSTIDQPSPSQLQFECKICGCPDVFQSENELTEHRQNVHHVCPSCKIIFNERHSLELHLEFTHSSAEDETTSAGSISPKDVHKGEKAKTSKDEQSQSARKRQDPPSTASTPTSPAMGEMRSSPTGEKRQQGPSTTVAPASTYTSSSPGSWTQLSDLLKQQSMQTEGTATHSRQTPTVIVTISIPAISVTRPTTTTTATTTRPTTIATDTVIRPGGSFTPVSTSAGGILEKDAYQDVNFPQRTDTHRLQTPTLTGTRLTPTLSVTRDPTITTGTPSHSIPRTTPTFSIPRTPLTRSYPKTPPARSYPRTSPTLSSPRTPAGHLYPRTPPTRSYLETPPTPSYLRTSPTLSSPRTPEGLFYHRTSPIRSYPKTPPTPSYLRTSPTLSSPITPPSLLTLRSPATLSFDRTPPNLSSPRIAGIRFIPRSPATLSYPGTPPTLPIPTTTVTHLTTTPTAAVMPPGGSVTPTATSVGGIPKKDDNQDMTSLQRTQPRTRPTPTATITRPIECEECGVEFNSKEELAKHERDVHKKEVESAEQRFEIDERKKNRESHQEPQRESGPEAGASAGRTPEKDANGGKKRKRSEDDQPEPRRRLFRDAFMNLTELFVCTICETAVLGNLDEICSHLKTHNIQENTDVMKSHIEQARRKGQKAEKKAEEIRRYFKDTMYECGFVVKDFSQERSSVCKQTFSTQTELKEHVKTVHRKNQAFVCQICTERFLTINELIRHYKEVHGIKTGPKHTPYRCNNCGQFFEEEFELNSHENECYKCEHCGAIVKSKEELDQHIQDFHKKSGAEFAHSQDESGSKIHSGSPCTSPESEATPGRESTSGSESTSGRESTSGNESTSESESTLGSKSTSGLESRSGRNGGEIRQRSQDEQSVLPKEEKFPQGGETFICPEKGCNHRCENLSNLRMHLQSEAHNIDPGSDEMNDKIEQARQNAEGAGRSQPEEQEQFSTAIRSFLISSESSDHSSE